MPWTLATTQQVTSQEGGAVIVVRLTHTDGRTTDRVIRTAEGSLTAETFRARVKQFLDTLNDGEAVAASVTPGMAVDLSALPAPVVPPGPDALLATTLRQWQQLRGGQRAIDLQILLPTDPDVAALRTSLRTTFAGLSSADKLRYFEAVGF